jgi:hypothetical protein
MGRAREINVSLGRNREPGLIGATFPESFLPEDVPRRVQPQQPRIRVPFSEGGGRGQEEEAVASRKRLQIHGALVAAASVGLLPEEIAPAVQLHQAEVLALGA